MRRRAFCRGERCLNDLPSLLILAKRIGLDRVHCLIAWHSSSKEMAHGACRAGVYEALAEADLYPERIAGTSIGAIDGALIAGNAPEPRIDKRQALWERITANRVVTEVSTG
jgi:hypothetical protein